MSKSETVPFAVTLEVRDACFCLHLQRAARAIGRRYDEVLRPLGLTNGQFSLMMSLNRPNPPTMGSVSSLLAMDRTTLTAALKPLQRRGLVTVAPDPNDKRSRLLSLTKEGLDLLTAAIPVWRDMQARIEELVASEPEIFRADLRCLS